MERAKTAAAEERASKYRLELDETDHKYKSLLNELEISKRQAPDPHLQAEVKSLLVEKNELEKRIDSLSKAKQHYKLQWSRAIKVRYFPLLRRVFSVSLGSGDDEGA